MYRLALSLSHDLSLSDLRIALINDLCAKKAGDRLIIRLDDTHRTSTTGSKEDDILPLLELFGIHASQLYYQSHNFKYHLQFASTLLDKKKAFICFCSQEKKPPYDGTCEYLGADAILDNPNPFVIRMKKPKDAVTISDILQGNKHFKPEALDNFIIMHTDKYPTSTFATACDDMLQGVTTIIREETHWCDAPREEWIRKSLGYDLAMHYAHLPILLSETGRNIDEEEKTFSVQQLLDQGFLPEAIANYLILVSQQAPCEIFTLQEAIAWFDINAVYTTSARFEIEKLRSINREHIKRLGDMELSKRLGYACENIGKLAKLYTEEADTTYEIKQKVDTLFAKKTLDPQASTKMHELQRLIFEAPYLETFEAFQAYLAQQSTLKSASFFQALRFWLTGADQGPKLENIYPFIKNYLKEIVR